MNGRILVSGIVIFVAAVPAVASPPDRPKAKKTENTVEALFEGIPQDLRTKVQSNPVRCDRVNDWLQENVNGKEKFIDVRVDLHEVVPYRRDTGYLMHLMLGESKVRVLDADWVLQLSDHKLPVGKSIPSSYHFSFEGVGTADAEKTCDLKSVAIKGRVKEAKISRLHSSATPTLSIILEEVLVENNRWTPYKSPTSGGLGGPRPPVKGKGGPGGPGAKRDPQP